MNNEPVAWMNRLGRLEYEQGNGFEIPLYTHPAKTLTDAEYDNIFANGKRLGVIETEDRFRKAKTLTDEEIWAVANDYFVGKSDYVYDFAKAILKKAQEK